MLKLCTLAILLVAAAISQSNAEIRHDRLCDPFQDNPVNLTPNGGNAILFGACAGIQDLPAGKPWYRAIWWNAYNCGYEAFRKNTKRNQNPYLNEDLNKRWAEDWDIALEACEKGKLTFGQ